MTTILVAFLFLLLGICWGSLLNWLAGSVSEEGELHLKAPFCRQCGVKRPLKYTLPLLGYFLTKGRCPDCREAVSVRIPIVEFVTGVLFALLYLKYGLSWELCILLVYSSILIVLCVTDIEHFILPNIVNYPGMIVAAAISLVVMLVHYRLPWALFFAGSGFMAVFNNYLLSAVAGGLAGALLLFLVVLLSRGGMGMGDVVLAGLLGLMVGFPLVFIALFVGIVVGGLVAAVLLITRRKGRKDMLPFGPFLCVGGLVTLLWGKQLLVWYLSA